MIAVTPDLNVLAHQLPARKQTTFGRDPGLRARMLLTMFLLGVVYAVLIGALIASGARGWLIAVVAGGLFVFQLLASDKLALRAAGARVVSAQEYPLVHATVERLCVQADLPKPRIAVVTTSMPNAFAMGRSQKAATVCVTTGIVGMLEPTELEAVLAHELAHVINRDVVIMTVAAFFASIASMVVRWGGFFGGGNNDDDDDSFGVLILILVLVAVPVSFVLMQALSRYREFAADRTAAVITGRPSALASALQKIHGTMNSVPTQDLRAAQTEFAAFYIVSPRVKAKVGNLFSTHPPLDQRLAALSRLEAQLQSGQ